MFTQNRSWLLSVMCTCSTALLLVNCSSMKKAEVSSMEEGQVVRLEDQIRVGYANHYDVLASSVFDTCQNTLDKAKRQLRYKAREKRVLELLAKTEDCLNRTKELAESRRPKVETLIQARQAAINAGSRNFPFERARIGQIDDEFRKLAERLSSVTPDEFGKVQGDYFNLEAAVVQTNEIGQAREKVEEARREGARRYTPQTLTRAERAIKNAENLIKANVHYREGYQQAVETAQGAATFLTAVLAQAKRSGKPVPEDAAIEMVRKNRELASLNSKLESLESNLEKQQQTITKQESESQSSARRMKLDQAFKEASKQFTSDEAEVFRQGDRLLIRLKAMKFPLGRSELPSHSIPLLSKVKDVAKDLGAAQVMVEGHTDATGPRSFNQQLSQARAEAVAKYFSSNGLESDSVQAIGYGDKKPLISNKSKEGRAMNRRVDVVLIPLEGEAQPGGSKQEKMRE